MHLKPCYRCPHQSGCDIKANVLAKISGLKFTSGRIKCDLWWKDFPGGQRVAFVLHELSDDRGEECDFEEVDYTGTAMRPHKDRLLVWLDEPTRQGRNPIAVRADRVGQLTGMVRVCPECQQPEGTKPQKRGDRPAYQCDRCLGRCDRCYGEGQAIGAYPERTCGKCGGSGRYDYEAGQPLPKAGVIA